MLEVLTLLVLTVLINYKGNGASSNHVELIPVESGGNQNG